MYEYAKRFSHDGIGVSNPNIEKDAPNCPKDCGLCKMHKSHTALANIIVTNRCDLNCWYCFFFAEKAGYIYEPTQDQIRKMLKTLRNEQPVPCNAVQLTGGEPTMRKDLIDIIKLCKEEGFEHVQVNTDGIKLSQDPALAKKIKDAGSHVLYLSFDGVTAKTNPKNHWEAPAAIENCRNAGGPGVVLVPTVINGVNDHELGDMLKFAADNIDIVRGLNLQPVSLVGRMPQEERKKFRITIPDVIKKMEEQTDGQIGKEDFYPVPCITSVSNFVEALTGDPQYSLSSHFACGMATYVFKEGDKLIPITRFVDVEGFFELLNKQAAALHQGKSKYVAGAKLLTKLNGLIDKKQAPEGFSLGKILYNALVKHDYKALGEFHHKTLFLGMMHFQDLYNYDIERVKRCCIHYATPDGKVIPFCAFNVIPEWYRDKIQKEFSVPISEWEKQQGRKLSDDLYKRKIPQK